MLVWTIQPKIVYKEIKTKGYFITDPKYSEYNYMYYGYKDDKIFKKAYDFLIDELNKRMPKPKGYKNLKIPIWAYYKINGKNEKIDMKYYGKYQRKPYVLFELNIPDNEIVIFDSDEWITILNNLPLKIVHNEIEYDEHYKYYDSLSDDEKERYKIDSWKKYLFDVNVYTEGFEEGWEYKREYLEGVFWILKKKYINKVWIYNDNL